MNSTDPVVAPRSAVVIGGSLAGIVMSAALAGTGYEVTVVERDRLFPAPQGRPGVPQGPQPHILLRRGVAAIEAVLPGFRRELLARGAVAFDGGRMPWLGEYGWLDTELSTYEVVSATRPLIEMVARTLLVEHPSVRILDGVTVKGLRRTSSGWLVVGDSTEVAARVVVDASGRSTRLAHWLPELRPPQEVVDAKVGYAGRLYRERSRLPLRTGVMIFSTVEQGMAGLMLPVEDRGWLVAAAGFGDNRPPRDEAGFQRFLRGLRDPALVDLTARVDPVGEIAIHRQTANLRRRWDQVPDWPDGLLVVGDALCALNPVYGQGITVAAQQAEIVAAAGSAHGLRVDRALQRRMQAVTTTPWAIATGSDRRMPSCPDRPTRFERWSNRWASRIGRLAAAGDARATRTIAAINNLMLPPAALFHPALVLAAARPLSPTRLPRPAVLDELSRSRRPPPPVGPGDA